MISFARIAVAMFLTLTLGGNASGAEALPDGPIILTRSHGEAVVVWDASDELAALISNKTSDARILRTLEAEATSILKSRAATIRAKATSLTVHVIYKRTGAVSPAYQAATLTGIERLLTVKAGIAAAIAGETWSSDILADRPPKDLTITIIGKLPPNAE